MPRIVGADLCTTSRFHSSMSSIFRAFLGGALLISMSIFALMMWKVRALADSTERTTGLRGQVGFHSNMLIFMGHGWSWGISTLRITMFSNLEPGWTWYIFQPGLMTGFQVYVRWGVDSHSVCAPFSSPAKASPWFIRWYLQEQALD